MWFPGFNFEPLYPKTKTWKSPKFYKNWKSSIISSWNTVRMTSNLKWFSHIANHGTGLCFLRASDSSGFRKLSTFFYVSFNTQKVKTAIKKQTRIYLCVINPRIKTFRDFWVFVLSLIPKNENSEIKWQQTQNGSLILFKLIFTLFV